MLRVIFLFILVLLMLFPQFGLAEEEDQEKREYIKLEEILVTARKLEKIHKDDVKVDESTTPVGANPVDILQNEAGIDMNRLSLFSPKSEMMKLRTFDMEKTIVRYPILEERFMIYAGCEKILDTDYQESYGYPMPGRMFYGGLQMFY